MNAPILSYIFEAPKPHRFGELSMVRLIRGLKTSKGVEVPPGSRGAVVLVYAEGEAYEVEFSEGLATVYADMLEAAAPLS
jgi:hypothetical protein